MTKNQFIFFLFFLMSLLSCTKDLLNTNIDYEFKGQEWAAPLVNTQLTVNRIVKETKGNIAILLGDDGKATVQFRGEVLRENSAKIFPPLPYIEPFYILDDTTQINLFPNNPNNVRIDYAIFKGTNIAFVVETSEPEDVDVTISIPEVMRDGRVLTTSFSVPHNNGNISKFTTPLFNIDKWEIRTKSNIMNIVMTARKKDGTKAKIENAYMTYDFITFSYIEGYHGHHVFPLKGKFIDISLFNKWLSGGFDFQDPKISLIVENSFGVPVRSEVKLLELTSITGNTLKLQSEFIDKGIDFNYPRFDEIGQTKSTVFNFDKSNSNIRELFNEKTKTVTYEINALINPERDTTIRGFITDLGSYVVNVAAEVPLHGSVSELLITDTLDIKLDTFDLLERAEFKLLVAHDFPAEVNIKLSFKDETGNEIDNLIGKEGLALEAAPLLSSGRTKKTQPKVYVIDVDKKRYEDLQKAKNLVILGYVNTTDSAVGRPLWIYGDYGFDIKVGVKVQLNGE